MIETTGRFLSVVPLVLLTMSGRSTAQAQSYEFQVISVPGAVHTHVFHINPQGHVVGRFTTDTDYCTRASHSFVWKNGTFEYFDVPGAYGTMAEGINALGEVTGRFKLVPDYYTDGRCNIVPRRAFVRSRDGAFTEISPPDSIHPGANQITPSGMVVGPFIDARCAGDWGEPGCIHGYLLHLGVFHQIDVPGSVWTDVRSINPEGAIVGTYEDVQGTEHGFLLRKGQFVTVDYPGATRTAINDINSAGDMVGYARNYDEGWSVGFVLSGGKFIELRGPDGTGATPWGINAAGTISGGWADHGFVARRVR